MERLLQIATIAVFSLVGCAMGYGATPPPTSALYCALADDPSLFVGKQIVVRAVYRYGFEIQRLDPTECCPGKKSKIWVEIGLMDAQSKRIFNKFPKGTGLALATFSGKFEVGGPFGDGGYRYRLSVDHIMRLEATGHPSEANQPPWTVSNCTSVANETHSAPAASHLMNRLTSTR